MSLSNRVLRALADAGATTAMIIAAVEADREDGIAHIMNRRARDAERKREQRAWDKASEMSRGHSVTSVDSSGQNGQENPMSPLHPPKDNNSSSLRSEGAASAPDSRTLLFAQGLQDLVALSGRPSTKLRPLLGKWLRDVDDDALRILTLISKAKEVRPADPIPWIEKHFQQRAPPINGFASKPSQAQAAVDVLERLKTGSKSSGSATDFGTGTALEASDYRRTG